jgi:hypothetical protein
MNTPEARTPDGTIVDQAAPAAPPVVPDAYEFRAPEGVTLDADTIAEASPIFKELGLSQEQAQKLVDFYAARGAKTNESLTKAVEDMRADWRSQVMADKDIGSKLDSVKIELGRAKDRLPPTIRSAFDEALNLTGLGDHPAIVKGFYEMAKLVNEGTHVSGAGPSAEGQTASGRSNRPSIAGALYPNLSQ